MLKTRTNYWFRHVWEYWWPLYPGVILTFDLTGLQIWQLILVQAPVSLLAITGGYLFLLRRIPRDDDQQPVESATGKSFLSFAAPIATVIATYAAILIAFPAVKNISRYIPIMVGLFLSLIVLQIQRKAHWSSWKEVLLSRRSLNGLLLPVAVVLAGTYCFTLLLHFLLAG